MSRTGPAHYHQGSNNVCHCAYSDVYHHTTSPYIYPQTQTRPRPVAGHPSEYAPAVRRVPKPKAPNKIAKSRELKFDDDAWAWYFETKEAPGVKWRDTVWHIEDLPQAKDSEFNAMVYEYYMCGHVLDEPDRDKLPVMPGGRSKTWQFKRAAPPLPPASRTPSEQYSPPPQSYSSPQPYASPQPYSSPQPYGSPSGQYSSYAEPIYRHPAAPTYASGSAYPTSMRIPSNGPHPDGWRVYSNAPPHEFPPALTSVQPTLGPLPGTPGPRQFVDATAPRRHDYRDHQEYDDDSYDDYEDEESEEEEPDDSEYDRRSRGHDRGYIPPPSPKSLRRARKLRERGYIVTDPRNHAELDALEARAKTELQHSRSNSTPNLATTSARIEIHRLLQTRTTFGLTRMPDLVFDLRYDPRHAFDRTQNQETKLDLSTAPAFQPGQQFVRLVIRHPFNGRGGDWVEDIDEAQYMTVMDVLRIISEMVHRNIDQKIDWDPLSEFDKSFVYEAYLNRPCPDEEATGRRLHLFCEKYMFGGIEQLPPKAKGTTAEGPSFLVKLIKNSKHKRYDKIAGFRTPSQKRSSSHHRPGHGRVKSTGGTTFPYLTDDARRTEG